MGLSLWWVSKVFCGLSLILYTIFIMSFPTNQTSLFVIPLFWGQFFVLFGSFISLWHFWLFKESKILMKEPQTLLTTKGLFSKIRHPMYLGDFLVMGGFFLFCANVVGVILLVIGWISLLKQCKIEEQLMAEKFGLAHQNWKQNTTLILPGLF